MNRTNRVWMMKTKYRNIVIGSDKGISTVYGFALCEVFKIALYCNLILAWDRAKMGMAEFNIRPIPFGNGAGLKRLARLNLLPISFERKIAEEGKVIAQLFHEEAKKAIHDFIDTSK